MVAVFTVTKAKVLFSSLSDRQRYRLCRHTVSLNRQSSGSACVSFSAALLSEKSTHINPSNFGIKFETLLANRFGFLPLSRMPTLGCQMDE